MPDKETIAKARKDKRAGKSASTQAGEFVHAEIDRIRRGVHGARSPRQAIAIGLSEARRAGVDLPPPANGKTTRSERKGAKRPRAAKAATAALKREPRDTVSHDALSAQAKKASAAKGAAGRKAAAKKAARTRKKKKS